MIVQIHVHITHCIKSINMVMFQFQHSPELLGRVSEFVQLEIDQADLLQGLRALGLTVQTGFVMRECLFEVCKLQQTQVDVGLVGGLVEDVILLGVLLIGCFDVEQHLVLEIVLLLHESG